MRKTLATVALVVTLSCASYAGEMHTPGAPAPPPTSPVQEPADGATLNGVMHTPGVSLNGEMHTGLSDILTETALELLAVLPALL